MQHPVHYISALRVMATFLVILIHASTGYLNQFSAYAFDWNYANVLNSFSRFCVPLFVMISGALLLPKKEETTTFYQKRMSKILWPFLFWIVIYLVYYFYRYTNFEVLPAQRVLEVCIDKVLHGPSAHLWFLYMIVGLYLAIPFLRLIVQAATDRDLILFIILWLASLLLANKSLYSYVPKIDLTFFSGYIGYLVLGYYLSTRQLRIGWPVCLLAFVILGLCALGGTWLLSHNAQRFSPALYNYLGINNALMASCLFLAFQKIITQPLPRWIQAVDLHSFGIYLVHILVLNYLHPLIELSTAWKIPAASLLTLAISFAIIYILRKVPYLGLVSG